MKKKFILFPLLAAMTYVALTSYSSGPALSGGLERTGASGGTIGCGGGGCHSTGATTGVTVLIELYSGTTLVTSYTPGTAYTIRITGTQTSSTLTLPKCGFQVGVVKTATTTSTGTLAAIAGTHTATASGISLVEQSGPIAATTGTGGSGTTYVLNIPWTAPVAGTGSVTVYAVLNALDNVAGNDAGDKWNNSSLAIPEAVATTAPITGTLSVCIGSTTALADATTGGTWSSSTPAVGSISTTGVVTGLTAGTTTISYTVGGTPVTAVVTVNPLPAAIAGNLKVCPGHTTTLTDATTPGGWISGTTTVATVGSLTGVVTGVAAGTSIITYGLLTGCYRTATVTVNTVAACKLENPVTSAPVEGLNVYPNPVHDGNFTLNLVSGYDEEASILITNIVGARVKEISTRTNKATDVSIGTTPGIYLVNVLTEHGKYVSKVIVQ